MVRILNGPNKMAFNKVHFGSHPVWIIQNLGNFVLHGNALGLQPFRATAPPFQNWTFKMSGFQMILNFEGLDFGSVLNSSTVGIQLHDMSGSEWP